MLDATNNQLTTVYRMSPMWVNFSISENRLLELQKQIQAGQLIVPANDNFTVEVILPDGSVLPNTGKLILGSGLQSDDRNQYGFAPVSTTRKAP